MLYNTLPFGFIWIWTYIWSISLCQISQLQESETRPTCWTLSYSMSVSLTKLILLVSMTLSRGKFSYVISMNKISRVNLHWVDLTSVKDTSVCAKFKLFFVIVYLFSCFFEEQIALQHLSCENKKN